MIRRFDALEAQQTALSISEKIIAVLDDSPINHLMIEPLFGFNKNRGSSPLGTKSQLSREDGIFYGVASLSIVLLTALSGLIATVAGLITAGVTMALLIAKMKSLHNKVTRILLCHDQDILSIYNYWKECKPRTGKREIQIIKQFENHAFKLREMPTSTMCSIVVDIFSDITKKKRG